MNTYRVQESTTMNTKRIEENNDREYQRCPGKQQPHTIIKSKENKTMNITKDE
jgi:hypothetical protein